jgi:hypothetical protein
MAFYLIVILAMAWLVGYPVAVKSEPRAAPADPCALVPADLVALLVPAPGKPEPEVRNNQPFTNRAECAVRTDHDAATTNASASLRIEVERNGSRGTESSSSHSQTDFANGKRYEMQDSIVQHRVNDLRGIGDSAYLTVDVPRSSGSGSAAAQVTVLRGDIIATVMYSASPSSDEQVAAAAVRVARELVKAVR